MAKVIISEIINEKEIQLFEERFHMENLLNTRFNFFLIVFAAILASLFTVKNYIQLTVIFLLGFLIEGALALTILRAQVKLKFYLDKIRKIGNHAEYKANEYANSLKDRLVNRNINQLIGRTIPIIVPIVLLICTPLSCPIFNALNDAQVNKDEQTINTMTTNFDKLTYLLIIEKHKNDSLVNLNKVLNENIIIQNQTKIDSLK